MDYREIELPVYFVRGGTSTGVIINRGNLPKNKSLIEEILTKVMGVEESDSTNPQLTGLGQITPTSNKVFIIDIIDKDNRVVRSELAQLANNKISIDWSVNCGNMTSAIPIYLLDSGEIDCLDGLNRVDIFNKNTKKTISTFISVKNRVINSYCEIPGVLGLYPQVEMDLKNPEGSKTGLIFPTGNMIDIIGGIEVTCIDVSVPMVIIESSSFNCPEKEKMELLKEIWVKAGRLMKLKNSKGEPMTEEELQNSETIPKVSIISKPQNGGNIKTVYYTPQKRHNSLAVSGGSCLASASIIEGTVAHRVAQNLNGNIVKIENPGGILEAELEISNGVINKIRYKRNAQILMKGVVKLYNLSKEAADFYL